MKHIYNNWSCKIFEGFYESNLYNSDTLFYIEERDREEGYIQENQEYFINWQGFTNEVSKQIAYNLLDVTPNEGIIQDIEFKSLYSPKYYNYETDSLILEVKLNLTKLKKYCFTTHKDNFNKYLKDNFTSYDGFISYIANNINDFILDYNSKITPNDREINIMIEYYLLSCIYESNNPDDFQGFDTSYHYKNYEIANEVIYQFLEIESDNEKIGA